MSVKKGRWKENAHVAARALDIGVVERDRARRTAGADFEHGPAADVVLHHAVGEVGEGERGGVPVVPDGVVGGRREEGAGCGCHGGVCVVRIKVVDRLECDRRWTKVEN